MLRWCDLISGSKIPPQLLDTVAPTWRAIYEESAVRVVGMYKPSFAPPTTPPVDNWSVQWTKRRTLLAIQQRTRHEARQSKEVWRVFGCLHLPKWDLDFIRRVLWRKLPVGARMERLGGQSVFAVRAGGRPRAHAKAVLFFGIDVRYGESGVWPGTGGGGSS